MHVLHAVRRTYERSRMITNVDEVDQIISILSYGEISWRDTSLAWNVSEYEGIDFVKLPYDSLWHPDFIVANAVNSDFITTDSYVSLFLYHTGRITVHKPMHLRTLCSFDLTYYPFDTQSCDIVFYPFFDDVGLVFEHISLHPMENPFTQSGQWSIRDRKMTPGSYHAGPIIICNVILARSQLYYIMCLIVPMLITSAMTSLVFWIPVEAGEKLSFLVSVFVSNAVFLNFIANTLPKNLNAMPRLALFLLAVNGDCLFAMIATVFIMQKHQQEQKAATMTSRDEERRSRLHHAALDVDAVTNLNQKGEEKVLRENSESGNVILQKELSDADLCRRLKRAVGKAWQSKVTDSSLPAEEDNSKAKAKTSRWHFSAKAWDRIFFVTFHVISIPFYALIFVF
ncbi:acetylcholine receptor subunit alpha [Aplysia californica]|uniref:Acetylcholine receptor subunit alpha n=1 Tax=Aplysia californica TaxID=6500 RepID=A0ABM1A3E6_APLCA|nr:acetylcholine receptor subunit alpha [Aplysia californica]